jgi:NAD+ diphosphatase
MIEYQWPEANANFRSLIVPESDAEGLYFVCRADEILQQFDDGGQWRPATTEEFAALEHDESHFMGYFGDDPCFAASISSSDATYANLRANLGKINPAYFDLAGRAIQVCDWSRTHKFCGNCGAETMQAGHDRSMVCSPCKLSFYPRLSPSIIVLVHRDDEVLLGRNHMFPKGLFSTLAGFVEPGESIEETVRREVKEEVGVNVGKLSYRGSQPWPFPNSLMLGFHAQYDDGDIVLQEDEIAEADWFRCDDLPMIPGKFAISRWLIDEYLSMRGFDY